LLLLAIGLLTPIRREHRSVSLSPVPEGRAFDRQCI
jgi:hypothetical protein